VEDDMTSIAVIGSGRIGAALAKKWAATGHAVTLAARSPAKPTLVELAEQIGAERAEIEDAVRRSDVAVFAIPGKEMDATLSRLGSVLDGKLVIDAANNVGAEHMNSAIAVAEAAPGAAYYRAFNSYGWEQIERPVVDGTPADAFYCGPDGDPRATIEQLIGDIGFRPMWVGGPEDVDVVDGLLRLWFTMVMKHGHSRRLAFKILEESPPRS
jgi:8-hydroxy-5-deazaflavin:NADPH oxidoreductase